MEIYSDNTLNTPDIVRPLPGLERMCEERGNFVQFIETFKYPEPKQDKKNCINLTPGDEFSSSMKNVLCKANTTYLNGLDGHLIPYVFEAVIDKFATFLVKGDFRKEPVCRFLRLKDIYFDGFTKNDRLIWRTCSSKKNILVHGQILSALSSTFLCLILLQL